MMKFEGYFGVTNFSSEMLFQDLYFTEISTLPLLTSLGTSLKYHLNFQTTRLNI